ncbi:hypothetical protein HHK36_000929 [Tetracentron sinense]|uniref:Probable quinone oxidoreductase n=1 Tax=Tetracentron sinense TaxID=13715 RepID=A0A835A2P9_TETSI|nr:hypothetical protein HHK36_000929 [Tetracentron sinense]
MVKAVRVHEIGGPEVLKWEDVEVGEPNEGEIRVKNKAIGLNFNDIYFRTGVYKAPTFPFIPGREAAGVVTAVGPGVTGRKIGDLVAYAGNPMGSYTEEQILPARVAVPVPPFIDPIIAASIMVKGMTAHFLVHRCFKLERGHTVLVHAAAGGVGSLLCQWANTLGATVIGTVSNEEKADQAKEDGCHYVIIYTQEDFVAAVNKITSGRGVDVVYDSVGKDTFQGSLACLKTLGYMVNFGQSSGMPDPVPLSALATKSLFLTRPLLMQYTATRDELLEAAGDVFANVASGVLKVRVNNTYLLSQVAQAHADLESRKTSGSVVLIPDGTELPNGVHFMPPKWWVTEAFVRRGMEAVGVVTAIGPGLTGGKIGDLVAYAGKPGSHVEEQILGSYAEQQILPASVVVPVPPSIDPIIAASVMLKGMTARCLLRHCFKVDSFHLDLKNLPLQDRNFVLFLYALVFIVMQVEPGHTVLVHAAGGGVGSLLCQWANALGATVIGIMSNEEKAAQAKEDGCHYVIIYSKEDFVITVNKITLGKGVDVVYDSVGKDTFQGSLACLKPRGHMVSFGQVSGIPDPVPLSALAVKSLFLTRPALLQYTATRDELLEAAREVFANVASGVLRVRVNNTYLLSNAAQAHEDLESRKTSGSVVLIPDDTDPFLDCGSGSYLFNPIIIGVLNNTVINEYDACKYDFQAELALFGLLFDSMLYSLTSKFGKDGMVVSPRLGLQKIIL